MVDINQTTSIITLNVSGLNAPTKRDCQSRSETKPNNILFIRNSFQIYKII